MSAPAGGDTTRTFNGPSTSGTGGSAGAAAATEGAAFGGTGLAHARTPIMRPTTSVGTHVRARTRGEQGLSSGMAVKVMSCDSPPRLFRLAPNCLRFCRLVYIRDLRAPPAPPPLPVRPDSSGARLTVNHHPTPTDPITPPGAIVLHVFAHSDVGRTREHNEDAFVVADLARGEPLSFDHLRTERVGPRGTLFMVADGMGGAAAGEMASEMAVEVVLQQMRRRWRD